MPTRMENRGSGRGHKRLFWVVGIIAVIALIGGGLVYAYSGSEPESASMSKSSSKSSKRSSTSSKAKSSSSVETRSATTDLTGFGFQIAPIFYNGEDVNKAMDENKALQNTFHDGAQIGYFSTASQARISGIAAYMYVHTIQYSVSGDTLSMNGWHIPLKVSGGVLESSEWDTHDSDGNAITWQIKALSGAQAQVESHQQSDSSRRVARR